MPKMKSDTTLPFNSPASRKGTVMSKFVYVSVGVAAVLATWTVSCYLSASQIVVFSDTFGRPVKMEAQCPQSNPLKPEENFELWTTIGETISTDAFKKRAVEWLGGAVRIPTESYDTMGRIGEDKRWDVMGDLHDYLRKAYPLIHSELKLQKVNTYGLLYTWEGSDPSLKPALMCAHQDVVPVDPTTVGEWTHPPYSGYFDGERIWGRGASDDKSGLIGTLSAVELLLERGYKPARTIVFPFGFDEESSGVRGAGALAEELLATWGKGSFAFIIDEGGGFTERYGSVFASPGIAEKGGINVKVEVTAPGGHSSVPPRHTSIGILSAALTHYENHPFDVHLKRSSPIYGALQCYAEYGKDVSPILREAIKKSVHSDVALLAAEAILFEQDDVYVSLLGSTQAIDQIQGGVKSNALPEQAWAIINHRIATESNSEEIKARDRRLLTLLAHRFNLTYTAFGASITEGSKGTLTLTSPHFLEPAPVTPTYGEEAKPYQLLAGTIKAAYAAHRSLDTDEITVSPGMPTGNTDTRFYWDLSEHIFRYTHHNYGSGTNPLGGGVHTVNESLEAEVLLEIIRFFTTLILNTNEVKDI